MGVLKSKSHIAVLLFMSWTAWVCLTITLYVTDNFWPQRWKWNENLTWTLDNMEVCLLLPPGLSKEHDFSVFFPEPFPYFPNISQHFQSVLIIVIFSFHSRSRSRPFPGIIASDSRSRISGTFFFIPFPFPNFGNAFFHSLPVPEFWEWIFSFPSRSRILGMGFFNSLPVPKLWEWNFLFPFPFPNP